MPFLLPDQTEFFPITVFQYGLGSYDLNIKNKDRDPMRKKVISRAKWAVDNMEKSGGWITFPNETNPYSAMAQGEGISLLIRAYLLTKEDIYINVAKKALLFMLKEVAEGGVCSENNKELVFYEFATLPIVYNGWIFAIFGLLDYYIITKDTLVNDKLTKTIYTLENCLEDMNNGYWSIYRKDGLIASPFYHNLHIAQLMVLYKYTGKSAFLNYSRQFIKYRQ